MQTEKRQILLKNPRLIAALAAGAVVLALVISLCISISTASNLRNEYAAARYSLGEELNRNLYMFERSYEGALLAGADVEGTIIPTMHAYYNAANTLDAAIGEAFGERYRVLNTGMGATIEAALQAFDDAFRLGKPTTDAVSNMTACIQSLSALRSVRFDAEGRLLPL